MRSSAVLVNHRPGETGDDDPFVAYLTGMTADTHPLCRVREPLMQ